MAEENPPTTPDDKGQTVRITLPTGSEESLDKTEPIGGKTVPLASIPEKTVPLGESNKGQTVRINTPPPTDTSTAKRETVVISTPPPAVPKKETTHLQATGVPAVSRPMVPPPPVPKPMMAPTSRPSIPGAPKAGSTGIAPLAPTAPSANVPVAPKPTTANTPKRETARIQIPPQPKTPLHKATVKLEQPKPASMAPRAAIAVASAPPEPVVVADPAIGILSVVTLVASLIVVAIAAAGYFAF